MVGGLEQAHVVHVRPAQIGDVCLLLEPTREEEIHQLRRHQANLQSLFGGIPTEKIHLTCQRFVCRDGLIGELVAELADDLRPVAHVAIKATGLETLYVPVRQTSILKWRIEISKSLKDFVAIVERRVLATGIQPLYKAGFVSSLVTALREVAKLDKKDCDQYDELPYHLFTGERVSLSRIEGVNKFDTLATIYWGR